MRVPAQQLPDLLRSQRRAGLLLLLLMLLLLLHKRGCYREQVVRHSF